MGEQDVDIYWFTYTSRRELFDLFRRLNPSVLDGSCLTGPTCRGWSFFALAESPAQVRSREGDANFVAAFDDALPRELLQLLQDLLQHKRCAESAAWADCGEWSVVAMLCRWGIRRSQ